MSDTGVVKDDRGYWLRLRGCEQHATAEELKDLMNHIWLVVVCGFPEALGEGYTEINREAEARKANEHVDGRALAAKLGFIKPKPPLERRA